MTVSEPKDDGQTIGDVAGINELLDDFLDFQKVIPDKLSSHVNQLESIQNRLLRKITQIDFKPDSESADKEHSVLCPVIKALVNIDTD